MILEHSDGKKTTRGFLMAYRDYKPDKVPPVRIPEAEVEAKTELQ